MRDFFRLAIKYLQCSTLSSFRPSFPPLPLPLPFTVFTDVAPRFLRRFRSDTRFISDRYPARVSLWVSKGSRREFGWLARTVSSFMVVPPPSLLLMSRNVFDL